MPKKHKTITTKLEIESVDIPTMYGMSDDEYREFVHQSGLAYVDHHDVLRSSPAGYPLATTAEQLDIYIDELQKLRVRLNPRDET